MAKAGTAVSAAECEPHPIAAVKDNPPPLSEEDTSLTEVLHLAQSTVATLKSFLDHIDNSIGDDFHQIMEKITRTREDMAHLNIKSADNCPIADAENELALVVKATEDATNRIMSAAETIMTTDPGDSANYHITVEKNIMEIFEACSFQDITGQRINKVVETLEFVDYRINKIARLFGIENQFEQREFDEKAWEEKQKRKNDLILHGPQDNNAAICQDDIDNLF